MSAVRLEAREHPDGNIRLCRVITTEFGGLKGQLVLDTMWIPRAEWDEFTATLAGAKASTP